MGITAVLYIRNAEVGGSIPPISTTIQYGDDPGHVAMHSKGGTALGTGRTSCTLFLSSKDLVEILQSDIKCG